MKREATHEVIPNFHSNETVSLELPIFKCSPFSLSPIQILLLRSSLFIRIVGFEERRQRRGGRSYLIYGHLSVRSIFYSISFSFSHKYKFVNS